MPSGWANNPNVNTYQTMGSQYGYGSPMQQWEQQQQWGAAGTPWDWRQAGFDPNNPFGQTMYNQFGQSFTMTPEMMTRQQWDMSNLNDQLLGQHEWVSPGNYRSINFAGAGGGLGNPGVYRNPDGSITYNMGAMSGMFGGGSGMPSYQPYGVTPWQNGGPAPEQWGGYDVNAPGGFSVSEFDPRSTATQDVINAALPGIYEQQERGFANAASRAGQSGFAMSTPYVEALGDVSRKSANDINALTQQYLFAAEESARQREMQEALQRRQLEEQAWATQGGWDLNSQLANAGNSLASWQTYGGWGQNAADRDLQAWMMQNQLGMQNSQNQNDWNLANWQNQQQQQMMQQQMMAQMLGGLMGGF